MVERKQNIQPSFVAILYEVESRDRDELICANISRVDRSRDSKDRKQPSDREE